ncbi:MAG TPA: hypothetical protein VMN03_02085 [Burkholderiales bacterium]|nr:hypothetical protein [Burkholderiales bacterium]
MTAGSSSIGHLNNCAHPGCLCQVNPGERYCGDYCRDAAEQRKPSDPPMRTQPARCGCGHAACQE